MKGIYIFCLMMACVACDCPNGFTRHNDFCYMIGKVPASWAEAVVYCQAVDAQLARVESDTEHKYLKTWLTQQVHEIKTGGVWLGGIDYLVEGEYEWAFPTKRISRAWWTAGQPDNSNGQNCVSMWKGDGFLWNDDGCSDQNYFLCQRSATQKAVIG